MDPAVRRRLADLGCAVEVVPDAGARDEDWPGGASDGNVTAAAGLRA